MKPLLKIFTGLVLFVGIVLSGCYKDVIKPDLPVDPNAPPKQINFSTELKPLFAAKCTDAGCHVSGSHKPYMTAELSYEQIVNGGFVNLLVPKDSRIYQMINGEMQQYIPSASDRQKVYDWIRNGAPNN